MKLTGWPWACHLSYPNLPHGVAVRLQWWGETICAALNSLDIKPPILERISNRCRYCRICNLNEHRSMVSSGEREGGGKEHCIDKCAHFLLKTSVSFGGGETERNHNRGKKASMYQVQNRFAGSWISKRQPIFKYMSYERSEVEAWWWREQNFTFPWCSLHHSDIPSSNSSGWCMIKLGPCWRGRENESRHSRWKHAGQSLASLARGSQGERQPGRPKNGDPRQTWPVRTGHETDLDGPTVSLSKRQGS